MALLLIEGFDHLTFAQVTVKGWSGVGFVNAAGRFGPGQSMQVASATITKAIPASATVIAGVAFKIGTFTSGGDVLVLRAGTTNAVRVGTNASNILQVRNSAGTVIATGTTPLNPNIWNFIELKGFINGASGTCEVRLNGITEIASTVGNFGSANIDNVGLVGAGSGNLCFFDDLYVVDTTGSAPRNTFLGDVRTVTIFPNADGAHSQWTPSTGVTHNTLVNETTPDGDTSYVSDATPGDLDTWAFSDIDGGATVLGLQTNHYARKDDAATRQIAPVVRQAGTDNVGTTVTLASTYQFFSQIYQQDPTAVDWTATTVNADEFGVKTIA